MKFYFLFLFPITVLANPADFIKSMAGCYEVNFKFEEIFTKDGVIPSDPYSADALEFISLQQKGDQDFELSHVLKAGPHVIKHWRQRWTYRAKELMAYQAFENGVHYFTRQKISHHANNWLQQTYQVDDSPRYGCSAKFFMSAEVGPLWECTTLAPLPRREATVRDDYQVLKRRNRHYPLYNANGVNVGWMHEQDNQKMKSSGEVIGEEKGYARYTRVDDARCEKMKVWWEENKPLWDRVQGQWEVHFNKTSLKVHEKVNKVKLYEHLFPLTKDTSDQQISEIIGNYLD